MRERLGLAEETYAAGLDEMSLNVIASPLQERPRRLRPHAAATPTRTGRVSPRRMGKVPDRARAVTQEACSPRATRAGLAPRRQVEACIEQSRDLTADDGYFAKLVRRRDGRRRAARERGRGGARRVRAGGVRGIRRAGRLARATSCSPRAPEADACGRERYALRSRYFLGATVDLEETYRWGQRGGQRTRTPRWSEIADRIEPGAQRRARRSPILDADPAVPAARHRRAPGLDAGARRRGHRRPDRTSTSTSPSRSAAHRVHASRRPRRRHLLHRPERGLQPARPHVVVGARRASTEFAHLAAS